MLRNSTAPVFRTIGSVAAAGVLSVALAGIALFVLGGGNGAFAQGVPSAEICNGKDDDGDGQADEGVNCDHYVSYLLDRSINPIKVVLRDQFLSPTDFTLDLIERLFNPARKKHAGLTFAPRRPDLHYLAYRLQSAVPFASRTVLVENQFERRAITVTKPRYLLTPTGKRKMGVSDATLAKLPANALAKIVPAIPTGANHYLCYDVEPYTVSAGIALKDQFQSKKYELLRARYLCNPVEKNHDGKVYQIVDEQNHMMCYEVIPHNAVNRPVLTHDQFGIRPLKPVRTEEFCVPTRKTPLVAACTQPDAQGTAVVFDAETHMSASGGQLVIVQPTATGGGLTADGHLMGGPATVIERSGSPASGETYSFDTEMLQLTLSSDGRVLNVPVSGQITTRPRTPGDPVQSFDTEMFRLQGQLPPGDPDFDLLRITAGSDFGLPSPGHTTLVRMPSGDWNVDSFFDITYRIDFVGAPGGSRSGQSGSTTATLRFERTCPSPN